MIRSACREDIEAIVDIHVSSFPSFFLTFLGRAFLQLLYESILSDAEGILLVAETNGAVSGFVAGVTQQRGFYRRLLEARKWMFARAALSAAMRRPAIVPRLIRALRRPHDTGDSAADACLMSIATRPEYQGRGVGRALVEAFCDALADRGVQSLCLTTDRDHNEATNQFYLSQDFGLARTFTTPEGRAMNEYVKYFDKG